ncbi:Uncharacterised protein [Burkholderia pseudomallei]|uniref:phage holin family protein n=1 Tax=Burkholderia TaxID=32008 RepID=UPI0011AF8EAB|nr:MULTISPECIES: phage holin family protein [Burkholderia]MBF3563840.1 hypothetical protein [Burkholderia pseudomallei]MBF3800037.1 hypothetical protein [Burkholderia pseudomallei]MBF3843890.1 hypothetical protein [Burkholderia pseudomallei]CAJ3202197.1 Uncharacterised protein [Burkholderia pseudomallei]CAJ9445841.1 Uncharacterised protein [Burkholderia pseudomallei]
MFLALTWSLVTYAATRSDVSFGRDLASIPIIAYVITVILSSIGGAASTLQKLSNAEDLSRWKLHVARDMVSSIAAGLLMFFIAESFRWDSAQEAAAITVAGYGSSKLFDAVMTRILQKVDTA